MVELNFQLPGWVDVILPKALFIQWLAWLYSIFSDLISINYQVLSTLPTMNNQDE